VTRRYSPYNLLNLNDLEKQYQYPFTAAEDIFMPVGFAFWDKNHVARFEMLDAAVEVGVTLTLKNISGMTFEAIFLLDKPLGELGKPQPLVPVYKSLVPDSFPRLSPIER